MREVKRKFLIRVLGAKTVVDSNSGDENEKKSYFDDVDVQKVLFSRADLVFLDVHKPMIDPSSVGACQIGDFLWLFSEKQHFERHFNPHIVTGPMGRSRLIPSFLHKYLIND